MTLTPGTLEKVDALHIALTHLVLEGGDLQQIAEELARVLDAGVLITTTDGRQRASSIDERTRGLLDEAGLFDHTGRFRVEEAPTAAPAQERQEGSPLTGPQIRTVRVIAAGADLGRIVAARPDARFPDDGVHAMERASAVVALLITRHEAVTAVENKYRGDFLRDVFLGRAGDEEYVLHHAAGFGWDLGGRHLVLCAEIDRGDDDPEVTTETRRQWQERFAAAWRQVARAVDVGAPSVDFSSEVVTLLPAPSHDEQAKRLVRRVVHDVAGDRGGGRRPFVVGIGRVADGVSGLADSYAQARRALHVGRRVKGPSSTTWFDQLGLHRLIALVPESAELRSFVHDTLGELAADTPEAADLRETLQVLLDTNFNVAEAARQQFFHYNTMRYRVGKLQRLLGPISSDPHLRLDVAVALKVLEIDRTVH